MMLFQGLTESLYHCPLIVFSRTGKIHIVFIADKSACFAQGFIGSETLRDIQLHKTSYLTLDTSEAYDSLDPLPTVHRSVVGVKDRLLSESLQLYG